GVMDRTYVRPPHRDRFGLLEEHCELVTVCLDHSVHTSGDALAGDGDEAGLPQEGEVVFEVPVLGDSALAADVLDVDGVEVDGLAAARDAAVGAGEVPLEHESGGEGVTGDVQVGQLAGEVGYRSAERCGGVA